MSHFSVLVIGENIDEQMLPYHEFECTGINEYLELVDRTDEFLHDFRHYGHEYDSIEDFSENNFGRAILKHDEEPDFISAHKYGYTEVDAEGNVVASYGRTNPNAKWDWYVVGGRWPKFYTLKDGSRTSQTRKGLIDLEATKASGHSDSLKSWEKYKDSPLRDLVIGKYETAEEYAAACGETSIVTYAIVRDGKWIAKGEMGWFGMSSNDSDNWEETFMSIWNEIDDDELVSIVDCHI